MNITPLHKICKVETVFRILELFFKVWFHKFLCRCCPTQVPIMRSVGSGFFPVQLHLGMEPSTTSTRGAGVRFWSSGTRVSSQHVRCALHWKLSWGTSHWVWVKSLALSIFTGIISIVSTVTEAWFGSYRLIQVMVRLRFSSYLQTVLISQNLLYHGNQNFETMQHWTLKLKDWTLFGFIYIIRKP